MTVAMKIESLMTITIALFSLIAVGEPIYAQQSDLQKTSVTINTDLVVTWAQVLDRKDGKVVKGLDKDDFILREDGKPQQISMIKEGQPISVVMLVRALACASEPPEYLLPRIHESLRLLGDDAEIALMSWQRDNALVQPLTRDHNVIAKVINQGARLLGYWVFNKICKQTFNLDLDQPRPGEAIYQAARYLEKEAAPGRRKIILMITSSGFNNKTHLHTADEVSEMLEKTGTTVYALNEEMRDSSNKYYGAADYYRLNRKDKRRRAGGLVEDFVEQTGGTQLVAKDRYETDEVFMKLTGLISTSYTIGYYPENSEFDGKFRRISLELSPRGKAKAGNVMIKTRNGYRALRPSATPASEVQPKR
jgi:Ca-activated chloride channel homolog